MKVEEMTTQVKALTEQLNTIPTFLRKAYVERAAVSCICAGEILQ